MVRWLAVAALVLSLALPSPAAADDGGGTPLTTWCYTHMFGGEICFNVTNFTVVGDEATIGGNWYGDGVEAATLDGTHGIFTWGLLGTSGSNVFANVYHPYVSTVTYRHEKPSAALDPLPRTNTIADITHVGLEGAAPSYCMTPGTPNIPFYSSGRTCRVVAVPEPGSLLLIATGFGGLFVTGWRRRRSA